MSVEGPGLIRNIQLLRALAACAVLYSHVADRIFISNDWRLSIAWQAGVDLFFVISGFGPRPLRPGQRNGTFV